MNITKSRIDERKNGLIKEYTSLGFNYHSVIRLNSFRDYNDHYTRPYNAKMSIGYIDRIMDSFVKRKTVNYAIAFLEQDDYLNNHLHFAWKCPIELSRSQISNSMKTKQRYIRDVLPIDNLEQAISYFSKRLYSRGSYTNMYI